MKDKKFDWLMTAIKVLLVTLMLLLIATIKCNGQTTFPLGSTKKDVMMNYGYSNFTLSSQSDERFEVWEYYKDNPLTQGAMIFMLFERKDDTLYSVITFTSEKVGHTMVILFDKNLRKISNNLWIDNKHWHKVKKKYVTIYYTVDFDDFMSIIQMSIL